MFPNPNQTESLKFKVADITVISPCSEIVIEGLDGNRDGNYLIVSSIVGGVGVGENFSLYPNKLTTNTSNYQQTYVGSTAPSTINGGAGIIPIIACQITDTKSQINAGVCYLNYNDGYVSSTNWVINYLGSVIYYEVFAQRVTTRIDNLTSLLFKCATANNIGVGSRIQLFKYV